mgnify:FL=1
MNKVARSLTALALSAALSAGMALMPLAYEPKTAETKADVLNTLGLFKGTENGYELDKPLTRMEALIMLIRLSGKELDALYNMKEYEMPFTDAPDWEKADKYLGYAFENGLAKGISDTEFDPETRASAQMYMTFLLRALGYTDTEEATVWDNWEKLATDAGLFADSFDRENFLRGDAVLASRAALDAKTADGTQTLLEKLQKEEAFSSLNLAIAQIEEGKNVTIDSPLIDIMGKVYAGVDGISADGLVVSTIEPERQSFFIGADAETLPLEEGIVCEPMMSSQAHSVALVRVKDGTNIEEAKKNIREKVNPRKWICVGVSPANIHVESIGNIILLVMDNTAPDALANNFRLLDESYVRADENGMIKVDDNYIEADEFVNFNSVFKYGEKLNTLAEKYFPENTKYFVTIPEKSYFVRDKVLNYLNHDEIVGDLNDILYEWKTVDLSSVLSLDDYYNTDRHWRQEKIFPVVGKLGEMMGFTVDEKAFTAHTVENFIGAYKSIASDIPAETLTYLTSDATEKATVSNFQNDKFTGVYETEKLESKAPYDVFLSGATPLTVIKNPNAEKERKLVLFRDSYGSSIAPLLISAYSEITLVDLRYMSSDLLAKHVDFTDAEVLFLMSDKVINNSTLLK